VLKPPQQTEGFFLSAEPVLKPEQQTEGFFIPAKPVLKPGFVLKPEQQTEGFFLNLKPVLNLRAPMAGEDVKLAEPVIPITVDIPSRDF